MRRGDDQNDRRGHRQDQRRADEEHIFMFRVRGCHHSDRLRLIELREIVEVGVLAILVIGIGIADSEILRCGMALGEIDDAATANALNTVREPVEVFTRFVDDVSESARA